MKKGFDISAWQEKESGMPYYDEYRMRQAKDEGNEFVIIKLGENYTVDEFFEQHITAALNSGLEVGVYYFSHAYDEATASQEADWVLNTLKSYGYADYHLQAGIWYDYEEHRQLRNMINAGALTDQGMTNCMSAFINRLWRAGFANVGIYSGYSLKPTPIAKCLAFLYGAHNMAPVNVIIQILKYGNTPIVELLQA